MPEFLFQIENTTESMTFSLLDLVMYQNYHIKFQGL